VANALKDAENRLSGFDILPIDKEHGFVLLEEMRGIAQAHGASFAQVAIAWLLAKRAVRSVLLGSSKRSQLDDNLKAAGLRLAPDELAKLDAATALPPVYRNWFIDFSVDQPVVQALAAEA
jgi:aryl-alcohol dehydrogenase-like predicted oxidoreductase